MAQWALHLYSDDAMEFYFPCIEIRPGRGLLISLIHGNYEILGDRTNFVSPKDHFRRVRAPLEFYSINGKKALDQLTGFELESDISYREY